MASNPLSAGYEKLLEKLKSMVLKDAPSREEDTGAPPPEPTPTPEPPPEPRELELGTEQHMEAMTPLMREVEADVEEDTQRRQKAAIMRDDFHEARGEAIRDYLDAEPEKAELYTLNLDDWQDYLSLLSEREKRKAASAKDAAQQEK